MKSSRKKDSTPEQLNLFRWAHPITRPEPRNDVKNLQCGSCVHWFRLTCPKSSFWLVGMFGEKKCIFRKTTMPANR